MSAKSSRRDTAYHECGFESAGDCLESLGETVWDYAVRSNVSQGLHVYSVSTLAELERALEALRSFLLSW